MEPFPGKIEEKIILFALLFLLISCSPAIKTPPRHEEPPPQITAAWERITSRDYIEGALKAIARLEISSRSERHNLKIALMLKRPSSMRVETIPVIGPPDFFLASNENQLEVFIPEKNTFYIGRPSKDNIDLFFPIGLSPEDLVSVMMGIPPMNGKGLRLEKTTAGREYRIDLFSDNHRIKTLIVSWDEGGHIATMDILDRYEEKTNTVTYGDYRRVGGIDLPHRITVSSPENKAAVKVNYAEAELSGDVESFDLPIPPDVKPILLDRKGGARLDTE